VRAACGAEILMHVGLETVALGGEGFIVHVCEGQEVKAGDRLISFDLDFLAQHAKSLITPIVVVNGDAFEIVARAQDRGIAVGERLMELRARDRCSDDAERRRSKARHRNRVRARPARATLIVTGLHHILNSIAWFLVGDFEGVTGDLNRFFKGDPSADLQRFVCAQIPSPP
jgi:hypothetical protein